MLPEGPLKDIHLEDEGVGVGKLLTQTPGSLWWESRVIRRRLYLRVVLLGTQEWLLLAWEWY